MKALALSAAINVGALMGPIIVLVLIVIILAVLASNIKVVQQSKAVVIERLGVSMLNPAARMQIQMSDI